MKCNELAYIHKNAHDALNVENLELNLYGNMLVSLPEGIFDQHSFSGIDVRRNPLRNLSKHFCSQNCTKSFISAVRGWIWKALGNVFRILASGLSRITLIYTQTITAPSRRVRSR